jgi:hypothetical protein
MWEGTTHIGRDEGEGRKGKGDIKGNPCKGKGVHIFFVVPR